MKKGKFKERERYAYRYEKIKEQNIDNRNQPKKKI